MTSKYIVLSSTNNKFLTSLDHSLHLDDKDDYEIALTSLELYYCFPNITTSNNIFRFSFDGGKSWSKIILSTGCYTLDTLYDEIKRQMILNQFEIVFTFSTITSRVKTIININKPLFYIDFASNKSFGNLLGFDTLLTESYNESKYSINILQINSVFVKTNLTEPSIYNNKVIPFIYSFFPVALPGDKIIEKPRQLTYHRLINKSLHHIEISLVDENDIPLDFNGELVTIRLHLKSIK